MTWQERAKELTGSPDYTHQQLKEEGYSATREEVRHYLKTVKVKYTDKKSYTETDVDEYMRAMRVLQEKQDKLDTKQVKTTISIQDTKPIAVALWGDWHMGGSGVDYIGLDKDTETIADTDGLYWVGMGDYKDNYQTYGHAGAQYGQLIQPGMQDKAVERQMSKVSHNNLALIRGCHDDWDYKTTEKDFVEHLCEITGAVNLWHGGDMFIELGTQKYHFKLRHKYKFESTLNVENSMRRIMEMQGECDVAGAAHLHNPYYLERHFMGQFRVMCRSGSYKIWDEFGQKIAGYKGKRGIPTLILFPDTRHIIPLMLDDAVKVLAALRKEIA